MTPGLRHVQTSEGRILVTSAEYRRFCEQQKRLAPRVLEASRRRRSAPAAPPKPSRTPRISGQRMSLAHVELPLPPFRWVASRKALVVAAVRSGQITFEDACSRFEISTAEMTDWMCLALDGEQALRITKRPGGLA